MPINLDDFSQSSNIKTYKATFFSDVLTGNGKTVGVLREFVNPRHIKDAPTYQENIHCPKRTFTNNDTTTTFIPFYIISPTAWNYIDTVEKNDMLDQPCTVANMLTTNAPMSFSMIPHSAIHEHTRIDANRTETKFVVCYQVFVCVTNNPAETKYKKVNYIHNLNNDTENVCYTTYTCDPVGFFNDDIEPVMMPYCKFNYNAFEKYIINYDLHDSIVRRSQEWQTDLPAVIESMLDRLLVNYTPVEIEQIMTKLARKFKNYKEIPLSFYKKIFDIIGARFPHEIARTINKQNLNLMLSQMLQTLESKKNLLPHVPAPTDEIKNSPEFKRFSIEQRSAIATTEPLTLVQAGAGTGKSTVVLGRIDYMVKSGVNPDDITVISFTNNAADNISAKNPNVHSMTMASMIHEIYAANYQHALSSIDTIINSIDIYYKVQTDFHEEFKRRLLHLKNRNDFASMNNFVEENFDAVIDVLNTIGQTSLELESIICYNGIDTFVEPDSVKSKFLIIDEVQDNSIFEFVYVLKYITKHLESLFMVGDCSQTLYEFRASDPRALNVLEESGVFATYPLQTNYRSNQNILEFANVFLREIEANRNANLQLKANSLESITDVTFVDHVQLHYTMLNKSSDLRDSFPEIMRNAYPYIEAKLKAGEQIAFLAYKRETVFKMKQLLEARYPGRKIASLIPDRVYNTTLFSSYIKNYWNQTAQMPVNKLLDTIAKNITVNLPYIMNNYKNASQVARIFINKWINSERAVILSWQEQCLRGQITKTQLLNLVRDNMLAFENRQNALKQRLTSERNNENKKNADIANADFLLSTIHSAKGLEFENTVIVISNKNQMPDDEKRMYYVALTRAMKSECILLYGTVKKPKIQADYDYVVKTLQKRNPSAANGRRTNIRITPKM